MFLELSGVVLRRAENRSGVSGRAESRGGESSRKLVAPRRGAELSGGEPACVAMNRVEMRRDEMVY
jgi:hypothetical protein